MSDHNPDAYLESIREKGFVPATRSAVVQVVTNTATLEELDAAVKKLRTEMDAVVTELGRRLEKLEKTPKP